MPRRVLDPRLLTLAIQATTTHEAIPSLDQAPEDRLAALSPTSPGYPWGWCDVTVKATYAGVTQESTLKGRSYTGQADFLHSEDYQNMQVKVLSGLLVQLDRAAEAASALGPRRVVQ